MLQPLQFTASPNNRVSHAGISQQDKYPVKYYDYNYIDLYKTSGSNIPFTGFRNFVSRCMKKMFSADKPFRLKIKEEVCFVNGEKFVKKCNLVKEFPNPNARKLYKQLKKTHDIQERVRIYQEMGEYNIIDLDLKKRKIY